MANQITWRSPAGKIVDIDEAGRSPQGLANMKSDGWTRVGPSGLQANLKLAAASGLHALPAVAGFGGALLGGIGGSEVPVAGNIAGAALGAAGGGALGSGLERAGMSALGMPMANPQGGPILDALAGGAKMGSSELLGLPFNALAQRAASGMMQRSLSTTDKALKPLVKEASDYNLSTLRQPVGGKTVTAGSDALMNKIGQLGAQRQNELVAPATESGTTFAFSRGMWKNLSNLVADLRKSNNPDPKLKPFFDELIGTVNRFEEYVGKRMPAQDFVDMQQSVQDDARRYYEAAQTGQQADVISNVVGRFKAALDKAQRADINVKIPGYDAIQGQMKSTINAKNVMRNAELSGGAPSGWSPWMLGGAAAGAASRSGMPVAADAAAALGAHQLARYLLSNRAFLSNGALALSDPSTQAVFKQSPLLIYNLAHMLSQPRPQQGQ